MAKFEFVDKYKDSGLPLPKRKTRYSAGYDLYIAEDTILSPLPMQLNSLSSVYSHSNILDLKQTAEIIAGFGCRPTLVSTGVKCQLAPDEYLQLVVRSSTPLKHWIVIPNAPSIVDSDYFSNESNDGEIFLQLINLAPFKIQLRKGDCIASGIISKYITVDDDIAGGDRRGGFGSTSV